MLRGDDSAAFASNWRTVLVVDALVGVVVSLGGVAVWFGYNVGVGAAVIAVGAIYVTLVATRARRWSRLRRTPQPDGDEPDRPSRPVTGSAASDPS